MQFFNINISMMTLNFNIALRKSYLSQKLFVTLSSVAVLHQKGRSRVNKVFYVNKLDVMVEGCQYLRVPWIGKPSTNLEKEVKTAVESCYGSLSTRLVFTFKRMLPVAHKDVLLTIQKSFVTYEYQCHCDSRYVGRASQRLQNRIELHVLQWSKTAINLSTPISTTQIVQTNRPQTVL